MQDLIAMAVPPTVMARWLRRLWGDGEAVLPLSPDAPAAERDLTLERLRPSVLGTVAADGQVIFERLPDARAVEENTALVVTTSGSTGRPRGVRLTHEAVAASTRGSVDRLGCGPREPWLTCLPTHHVAGIQTLLRSWTVGAEPVVHDGFDVADVASAPAPHVSLVPTQLWRLLEAGVDVARFATILLGGARPPATLLERARAAGARVVVSYGMTETCGGCVYDGVPLDGVEVETDTQQRIRLRGPMLLAGYHPPEEAALPENDGGAGGRGDGKPVAGDPDAPLDAEGWFVTGDVGSWDGRVLEVAGRADDVAISGGENVPLDAVVEALLSHPEVTDAAALRREDDEWGEAVVAVVVPRDPADPPSTADLREHVMSLRSAAFAPRQVTFVEVIPRGPLGKAPSAVLEGLVDG